MNWNRGRLVDCYQAFTFENHCGQIAQDWCLLSYSLVHNSIAIPEFVLSVHRFPFHSYFSSCNSLNVILLTKSFELPAEHVYYCLAYPSSFNECNKLMFIRSHKSQTVFDLIT